MKIQKFTGQGKRSTNQDLISISTLKSGANFFLIADGMGGYDRGDEAAGIISGNIFTYLNYVENINEQTIQEAIQKANLAIKQFNKSNDIKSGATLGGIIIDNDKLHFFWVGDVMILRIGKEEVYFQTKSHTLVNSLLESSLETDEKSLEKYKHIVTRSVSGKPSESQISYNSFSISDEDQVIICSDGVHNTLSIDQIIFEANKNDHLEGIKKLLEENSKDNYSLILIHF